MGRFEVWGVLMLLVASGFLGNALVIYLRRRRFLSAALPAIGTVIEVRVRGITARNALAFPVFEFTTVGGGVQRAESLEGTGFQAFTVGQQVAIRYDPADPGRAEVDSFAMLWGTALLRAGFGVLFLIMGVVGLIVGG